MEGSLANLGQVPKKRAFSGIVKFHKGLDKDEKEIIDGLQSGNLSPKEIKGKRLKKALTLIEAGLIEYSKGNYVPTSDALRMR